MATRQLKSVQKDNIQQKVNTHTHTHTFTHTHTHTHIHTHTHTPHTHTESFLQKKCKRKLTKLFIGGFLTWPAVSRLGSPSLETGLGEGCKTYIQTNKQANQQIICCCALHKKSINFSSNGK